MRVLKTMGMFLVVSLLVLSHGGPAHAISGSEGGSASTGKGGGGETTGGGGGSTTGGGGSSTNNGENANREGSQGRNGQGRSLCETPDQRLLSNQGTHVGNIAKVRCLKDGSTEFTVHLVHPFNAEARRATFRSDGRHGAGSVVRLDMTDHQIKKLIWMIAARH